MNPDDFPNRLRDALVALNPGRPELIEALRGLYDEAVSSTIPSGPARRISRALNRAYLAACAHCRSR